MRTERVRGIGLLVVVCLAVTVIAAPAGATERATAPTTVEGCTVIDDPGRYVLTGDISGTGTCIEITASDVTLDGQGHTLEATDRSTDKLGIDVNGTDGRLRNVTVTNVVVDGWRYDGFGNSGHAIRYERVDDGEISDVVVSGGDYGIQLVNATGTELRGNNVTGTTDGQAAVELREGANRNTLVDNAIVRAGGRNLRLMSSSNNTIHANEIRRADGVNVRVAWGSNGNLFTDNYVFKTDWGDTSVSVSSGSDLVFRNNTVAGSSGSAISIRQAGRNYTLVNNTVNGSGGDGIHLYRVGNVSVADNTLVGTEGNGIHVQTSFNVTVADNTLGDSEGNVANPGFGINLANADNSTVADNTVYLSGGGGIRLTHTMVSGSDHNEILDNTVAYLNLSLFPSTPNGETVTTGDVSTIEAPGANNQTRILVASGTDGIVLQRSENNTLRANTIHNGLRGFAINRSSDNNTLVDNTVSDINDNARWSLAVSDSHGTTVDSLDIGDSTAANTTVSLTGDNHTIGPATTPPANSDATAVGRYLNATNLSSDARLDLALHYEYSDVRDIDQPTFALWHHDGSQWHEIGGSTLDTDNGTVETTLGESTLDESSTYGAFGDEGQWPTPTTTTTDSNSGSGQSASSTAPGETTTSGSGPGFGAVTAALAVLLVSLVGRRHV